MPSRHEKRSSRFLVLEKELRLLRKHFLPSRFDPTGSYPARIHSHASAYRALAHAEFESFLEDRTKEVYLSAKRIMDATGRFNKVLTCLVAFSGLQMSEPPNSLVHKSPQEQARLDERLKIGKKLDAISLSFFHMLSRNHGIKEENVLNLLLRIGVEDVDLDPIWLSDLNSFGESRGLVVHSSASSYRTTKLADPASEYVTVQKLLTGFRSIDRILNRLAS